MRMIDALSLEAPMAEQRCLETELGVRWHHIDPGELSRALQGDHPRMLIVSDPIPYADVLLGAPSNSVAVIQVSDESYTPERRALLDFAAVRTVFRHYAPESSTRAQIAQALAGFVTDARRSNIPGRSALSLYRSGKSVRSRMLKWPKTGYRSLPLGYTNAFAGAVESAAPTRTDRSISISFRGNRGMATRIVGTDAAQQVKDSRVTFVEDQAWSGIGDQGGTYVEDLVNSRFALVPPGFVNAETFRYYEALRCGALPVELDVALTHQGVVPFRTGATIRAGSWRRALAIAATMPEAERASRVAAAQAAMDSAFEQGRNSLIRSMEG